MNPLSSLRLPPRSSMSNSCRMPLKAYLQCVRQTPCFKQDPLDARMETCAALPEVKTECATFERTYKQCKLHLVSRCSCATVPALPRWCGHPTRKGSFIAVSRSRISMFWFALCPDGRLEPHAGQQGATPVGHYRHVRLSVSSAPLQMKTHLLRDAMMPGREAGCCLDGRP